MKIVNKEEQYWHKFVEALATPVLILDLNGVILYANKATLQLLQKTAKKLLGKAFTFPFDSQKTIEIEIFIPPETILYADMITKKCSWIGEAAWAVTLNDVSERKQNQKKLKRMALFDPLTDLPNKSNLLSFISTQIEDTGKCQKEEFSLICLDVDSFKTIIKQYNYQVADRAIVLLAQKFNDYITKGERLAKISKGEFAFFKRGLTEEHVREFLTLLFKDLEKPLIIESYVIKISVSVGVVFFDKTETSHSAEQLLRQAEQALYQSEYVQENTFTIFDSQMDLQARKTYEMIESLKNAITLNQIKLYFQPKVHLQSNKAIGAEALMRWEHPVKGLLHPNEFLPLITSHHYVFELTEWTIRTALISLQKFIKLDSSFELSLNIDTHQLEQLNFIDRLKEMLGNTPPQVIRGLEFEILETGIISNRTQVLKVIAKCKDLGIDFSLDDFGTQYASLSNLINLPFKYVKIDKSLISPIVTSTKDKVIYQSILNITKALGLKVLAEGVENKELLSVLCETGCDYGQGYVFSQALPEEKFIAWYKDHG